MDVNTTINQEDRDAIVSELVQMIRDYDENPQETIEASVEDTMSYQSDEEQPSEAPEPQSMQDVIDESRARNAERIRKFSEIPAIPRVIRQVFHPTEEEKIETQKKVANSKKVTWAEQEMKISPGHLNIDGADFQYRLARDPVNWGEGLSDDLNDMEYNLDYIRKRITEGVLKQFGGAGRITEIVIASNQLIINKVMYVPLIQKKYIPRLPLDVHAYMENGTIAPLFNYRVLKNMSRLTYFNCDSSSFYASVIADDLGLNRRIGASSLFNICPSLETLVIEGESVTRETLNKPESKAVKRVVETGKRSLSLLDGWNPNIYAGTNAVQKYFTNSLSTWANNRGNRGFFKQVGGLLGLGTLAAGAWALNGAAHLIGGVGKMIGTAVKDAFKPVTAEEANLPPS